MSKENISAGIVLYNPNIERLKRNIDAITEQVDKIYCFNNGSNNIVEIKELIQAFDNVDLIDNSNNRGISYALNRMAEISIEAGYTWMLALDQDSICPPNMIKKFCKYVNIKDVGIICPVAVDKRRPKKQIPKEEYSIILDTITSGSLIKLDVYEKVGGSDEFLFVGLVDDEYCYRLGINGFKIIQVNDVILDHELGNIKKSKHANLYIKVGNALKSKKIEALSYRREVSPMRVYYAERNIIYLSYKYRNDPTYLFSKKYAIKNGISNFLRGQKKWEILKAIIKGCKDGKSYSKNEYSIE